MNRWIIGVTGPIASGKTLVSKYIESNYEMYHIDADKVGHQILEMPAVKARIFNAFPFSRNSDLKKINRKKLADIVFNNPNMLYQLNSITWPYIIEEIHKIIHSHHRCVIEAIGLFKSDLYKECGYTLYVTSKRSIIQKRLSERNLPLEKTKRILDMQEEYFKNVELADYIIENNSTKQELYEKIKKLIHLFR